MPRQRASRSYLDLDELKDISFSRMENDVFINNSTVSIPKMLINSSAVNFTIYGTHSFDEDYSYHVKAAPFRGSEPEGKGPQTAV
ncbi:MAG: AsmA-like C-terminal region-containing protein [Marinilabiliales bacterium]|nr:AsmA-like C-terminal region-containing protein [Marinilabiliales bacterium]